VVSVSIVKQASDPSRVKRESSFVLIDVDGTIGIVLTNAKDCINLGIFDALSLDLNPKLSDRYTT
jgi:hypothetical protein